MIQMTTKPNIVTPINTIKRQKIVTLHTIYLKSHKRQCYL